MALIDITRTAPIATPFAWAASVPSKLVSWNEARATRKALSQLTTRELEDIGLIPGDIEKIGR